MKVKFIVDEDIVNYKKTSMFIGFPSCSCKCDKDCGKTVCQNNPLLTAPSFDISKEEVIDRYLDNPITEAIVFGGLEPFDSPFDLLPFIDALRNKYQCDDDVVIYTGYTEDELKEGRYDNSCSQILENYYSMLIGYKNIIIKYGRFIPNQEERFDEILGVKLASNNQYAIRYNYSEEL